MKKWRCTNSFKEGIRYYWYGEYISDAQYEGLSSRNKVWFVVDEDYDKPLDVTKPIAETDAAGMAIFAAVNEILETKSSDPGPDPTPDPPQSDPPASNDLGGGDGGGAGAGGSY